MNNELLLTIIVHLGYHNIHIVYCFRNTNNGISVHQSNITVSRKLLIMRNEVYVYWYSPARLHQNFQVDTTKKKYQNITLYNFPIMHTLTAK